MTTRTRRLLHAMATVCALAVVVSSCGGGDGDDESSRDSTTDESTTTTVETTTTTLSPEEQVIADYNAAQAAVKEAYDPADPEHPDLLAHYAGTMLERHQFTLTEYQLEGVSDVLLSKESDPQVVSLDDTTAVVEDCMTEVLQMTDSDTREPQADERTYTVLLRDELELIKGTWKIVDGEGIEETC